MFQTLDNRAFPGEHGKTVLVLEKPRLDDNLDSDGLASRDVHGLAYGCKRAFT